MQIATKTLAAMLPAVSTEEKRYYINGVYVDAEGFLVATDGSIITVARLPLDARNAPDFTAIAGTILPRVEFANALKMAGKYTKKVDVTPSTIGAITYKPIDGAYPNWRGVIPGAIAHGEPMARIALPVLRKLEATAKALGGAGFDFAWNGPKNPQTVIYPGESSVFSVAMPVRDNPASWFGLGAWAAALDV